MGTQINHIVGKWICHRDDNRETRLVPVFRRFFERKSGLKSAKLYLTAHGIYEAEINGQPVTENKFTPGLTSYYFRIQVQEYDVTALLCEGSNELRVTVGDGWWRWNNNFGYTLALLGQLVLVYSDGSEEVIATDERFEAATGSIIKTDLQAGETFDARIEQYDWKPAVFCTECTEGKLIETQGVPVRENEHFRGRPFRDSARNLVIDFGQNIAGYVKMTLRNTKPGQTVHLKHGEGLDLEGRFSTANCDGGKKEFQEITYICRGGEVEEYTPHFAVFGFRYALVEGIEDADFTAVAVYSDMEQTGDFKCSNPLINKLVENARWSQKGNFLDVAVDCPTRERNAWTGDAMIYCRTAAYFMDVHPFFQKWLADQRIEQYASGKLGITFPSTSSVHNPDELERVQAVNPAMALAGPDGDGNIGEDSVGWGDSAVWIPYQLYLMYGDKGILEAHYDTAKRWLEYSLRCMKKKNPIYADRPWYVNGDGDYIYDTRFHYGEWNEPLPPAPEVVELFAKGGTAADFVTHMAKYGKPEVATAYTKRSCDNMAHIASILGKTEDAKEYAALSDKIKAAYNQYLIGNDGEIQKGHQAAYIRALALDMVNEEKKPLVIAQLKKELKSANYHLNTGFLSTVYLLPTLCDIGLTDEAFRILEQTDLPGWLYPVTAGATTMLERWEGMDEFRDSFNHYSFGAVCQFLFEYVAGIRPGFDEPGFQKFDLQPVMGGTLTWAKASYKTRFGTIKSAWERKGDIFCYSCTVPEGTTACLTLPDGKKEILNSGEYEFSIKTNKHKQQVYNPFLPSWEYIPDGEPHIYGDRLYLFGSHDCFNGTQFCMNDYVCWSCPLDDLSNWRNEGIIYCRSQDPAAKEDSIMQAPDVCQGPDGRYYLYYTLGLVPFMSVAVCDTPAGQYEYYGVVKYHDGTPVGLREHDIFQFDPGVFVDDDEQIWLYSGFGPKAEGVFANACRKFCMEGAYVMELQPDMLTVKSEPKMVFSKEGEHGFFEASSMRKIDGRYYFIYSSQLGHELCWAVGDKPDSMFTYGGTLVSNGDVGLSEKPRNYTGNTHGSLVKIGNQWYVFYHRQTNRHQYSRQACAEKISFEEGRFCQAEMTSCGLSDCPLPGHGEYEARIACNLWSKNGTLFYGVSGTPEAEEHPYFTQSGGDRECSGDQYIANMRDGSVAGFKYFAFDGISEIGVFVDCTDRGEVVVMTEPDNEPICRILVSSTGETKWFFAETPALLGNHALYFRFQGKGSLNLYSFQLL